MSEALYVEGPDADTLVSQIRAEHGEAASIVSISRARRGGMLGFFSRESAGVTYRLDSGDPGADRAVNQSADNSSVAVDAAPARPTLHAAEHTVRSVLIMPNNPARLKNEPATAADETPPHLKAILELLDAGQRDAMTQAVARTAEPPKPAEPARHALPPKPVEDGPPPITAPDIRTLEALIARADRTENGAPATATGLDELASATTKDDFARILATLTTTPLTADAASPLTAEAAPLTQADGHVVPDIAPVAQWEPPELAATPATTAAPPATSTAPPATSAAPLAPVDQPADAASIVAASEPAIRLSLADIATPADRASRHRERSLEHHPLETADRLEPAGSSARKRLDVLADLQEVGVPLPMSSDVAETSLYGAVTQVVDQVIPAPSPPRRAGDILVLAGPLAAGQEAAETLAAQLHIPVSSVWIAGGDGTHPQTITGPIDAARKATAMRIGDVPALVVVDTDTIDAAYPFAGSVDSWASEVIAALEPDAVWAVVDAVRKTEDIRDELNGLGPIDALIVHSVTRTRSPAAVWDIDVPVAMLDGRPATPGTWVALLFDALRRAGVASRASRDGG